MAEQSSEVTARDGAQTRFYVRNEGEGLVRFCDSRFAYLRAYGWVELPGKRMLRLIAQSELGDISKVGGWKKCTEAEAAQYALHFFNNERLDAPLVGRRKRLIAYLVNHDLWRRHRTVPHGPAPWRVSRALQEKAQEQEVRGIGSLSFLDRRRLDDWIAQARDGYKQEQSRIDGIQQRASFILAATGVTTAGVLANGSLLIGGDALPSLGMRIAVGALLMIATVALAVAAYAALEATMIMFELAQPNSPWQVERRVEKVSREEEPRYVLATTLLAAERAEVIGDWKIRQVKRARRSFAGAILLVLLANLTLLVSSLLS